MTVTPTSSLIIFCRESGNTPASRFSPPAIALRSTTRSRDGFISLSVSPHEEKRAGKNLLLDRRVHGSS
jgi:hypothetical protein